MASLREEYGPHREGDNDAPPALQERYWRLVEARLAAAEALARAEAAEEGFLDAHAGVSFRVFCPEMVARMHDDTIRPLFPA